MLALILCCQSIPRLVVKASDLQSCWCSPSMPCVTVLRAQLDQEYKTKYRWDLLNTKACFGKTRVRNISQFSATLEQTEFYEKMYNRSSNLVSFINCCPGTNMFKHKITCPYFLQKVSFQGGFCESPRLLQSGQERRKPLAPQRKKQR